MSLDTLASKLGSTNQNLSNLETGKTRARIEDLEKIAGALDVTLFDLLGMDKMMETVVSNVLTSLDRERLIRLDYITADEIGEICRHVASQVQAEDLDDDARAARIIDITATLGRFKRAAG